MQHSLQPLLLIATCAVLLASCSESAPTSPTQAPAASADNNIADGEVTTHVKTALSSEPSLAGMDITVVTTKGDIRLTGVVQSQAQIETAIKIARAAEGGHSIHDELTVKQ